MANGSGKYDKEKILLQTNAKIELLKILYRLVLNCQMIDSRKYLELEKQLQEAGKQAQGWLKYERGSK